MGIDNQLLNTTTIYQKTRRITAGIFINHECFSEYSIISELERLLIIRYFDSQTSH